MCIKCRVHFKLSQLLICRLLISTSSHPLQRFLSQSLLHTIEFRVEMGKAPFMCGHREMEVATTIHVQPMATCPASTPLLWALPIRMASSHTLMKTALQKWQSRLVTTQEHIHSQDRTRAPMCTTRW